MIYIQEYEVATSEIINIKIEIRILLTLKVIF